MENVIEHFFVWIFSAFFALFESKQTVKFYHIWKIFYFVPLKFRFVHRLKTDENIQRPLTIVCDKIQNEEKEINESKDLLPKIASTKKTYLFKYKNFICSPKSKFYYETV